jgi:hypothetical protein
LHDHPHQDTDSLSKPRRPSCVDAGEKFLEGRVSFKFTDNSGERSPIMMKFRFLHTPLPARVIEERKQIRERRIWIIHDVRKCSSLTIVEKLSLRDRDSRTTSRISVSV